MASCNVKGDKPRDQYHLSTLPLSSAEQFNVVRFLFFLVNIHYCYFKCLVQFLELVNYMNSPFIILSIVVPVFTAMAGIFHPATTSQCFPQN